jgi:hypothetical protein
MPPLRGLLLLRRVQAVRVAVKVAASASSEKRTGASSLSPPPPLKLLSPKRDEVPPPAQVAKLPKKYHEHIGHHEAHPGEGKGRLAVKLRAELEAAE